MRDFKKHERDAMDAVARQFSATWEAGTDPARAQLRIARKRVAVELTVLKGPGRVNAAKPHLRFDRVATRLIEQLQANLGGALRDGKTVLLTITAPIRLPGKTAAALEDKIQALLHQGWRGRDERGTIHGNRVRIRLARESFERAPRVMGFVHNSDSDPLLLLNMADEWLALPRAGEGPRARRRAADRWLIVLSPLGSSCLAAYRHISGQVPRAEFKKILIVFGDGRVGVVKG